MAKQIAFLRAINVGKRRVTMDTLRAVFEAMKFGDVATFIASGNVIFESRATERATLERRIEKGLAEALGYEVDTFIRTPDEVKRVAQRESAAHALYVGFLKRAPTPAELGKLRALSTPAGGLDADGREYYWELHTNLSESPVTGASIERALGQSSTMRNITMLRRLAEKLDA